MHYYFYHIIICMITFWYLSLPGIIEVFLEYHKNFVYDQERLHQFGKLHAKQKHLGCKKCGANQKQHCKQAGATKRFDIS